MTEIVNLNKVRKQRVRQAAGKSAAQNRITYGLTKQARENARREQERQLRKADGALLTDDTGQNT